MFNDRTPTPQDLLLLLLFILLQNEFDSNWRKLKVARLPNKCRNESSRKGHNYHTVIIMQLKICQWEGAFDFELRVLTVGTDTKHVLLVYGPLKLCAHPLHSWEPQTQRRGWGDQEYNSASRYFWMRVRRISKPKVFECVQKNIIVVSSNTCYSSWCLSLKFTKKNTVTVLHMQIVCRTDAEAKRLPLSRWSEDKQHSV